MSSDDLLVWGTALVLLAIFVLPYFLKHRKKEKEVEQQFEKAMEDGMVEPDTLHPIIDPNSCVSTGNCVAACPEKDVLGLLHGSALSINPTKCVGHGLCERVCPMEAIQLVVGTSVRGVDIPRIQENFETNIPGMYVIGELGGMGLIRNAFEQARQCVEGIAQNLTRTNDEVLDVLIVGCGPAGLAATIECKHKGLKFKTIEKEDIGGTVRYYPRKKLVMTAPLDVPGYGKLKFRSIVKEDLIALWEDIVDKTGVGPMIHIGEAMQSIRKIDDGRFSVQTTKGNYTTQKVVLAIGRRGSPRKLGIEGEASSCVAYSLIDPEQYQGDHIMVVGGGDSAVECAVALSEQPGNTVFLSYRKDAFSRIKHGNKLKIEAAIKTGAVRFLPASQLSRIADGQVFYHENGGEEQAVNNDYVFVMIGGTLPTAMLQELGIKIDTKFGEPLNAPRKG